MPEVTKTLIRGIIKRTKGYYPKNDEEYITGTEHITELETVFGIQISEREYFKCMTITKIIKMLKEKSDSDPTNRKLLI